jgi:hypothetical protein
MMPAGTYYIGDLCYVMTDSEWDEFCSLTINGNECVDGEFMFKDGRRFATYGTKWGDGEYRSNIGTKHSVDAGLIGCFRVEDIRAEKYDDIESLGAIVTFDSDFRTKEEDGLIIFGDVVVNTDPDFYEKDDEEFEYED